MPTIVLGDDGVITLDGTVQTVDFLALRNDVVSHHGDHTVDGTKRSNNPDSTETISLARSYRSASTADGDDDAYRAWSTTRFHTHLVSGLTVATTNTDTAITPSGTQVFIDHTDGHITCYTIDGYDPEAIYDRYRYHTHGFSGGLTSETLPAIEDPGGSTYYYYYTQLGGVWGWRRVKTNAGAHSHGVGTLALQQVHADDAPAPPVGTIAAGSPRVALRKVGGNIEMKGRVNTIGILAFYNYYINHDLHLTTGLSASGGGEAAQLYDYDTGGAINMEWSGGSGLGYVNGQAHQHAVTTAGYIVGPPV